MSNPTLTVVPEGVAQAVWQSLQERAGRLLPGYKRYSVLSVPRLSQLPYRTAEEDGSGRVYKFETHAEAMEFRRVHSWALGGTHWVFPVHDRESTLLKRYSVVIVPSGVWGKGIRQETTFDTLDDAREYRFETQKLVPKVWVLPVWDRSTKRHLRG